MQGLGIQFNPESIAKLKSDYDKVIQSLESRKINLNFNDINKSINQLTEKIRELQGIKLSNNILPINIKEQVASIQQAVNAYKEIGRVNVKEKIFDDKSLSSFVIELERANGIINKIKYTMDKDKNGNFTGVFNASKSVKETDNSLKLAQQMVKEEEKLANAIGKVREQSELKNASENKNLQLKQAQSSNKALEQEYIARQKVQEAIAKTIAEREREKRATEESQSKAINKALEQEYLLQQRRQQYLNTLGKSITNPNTNFNVSKSTYTDMSNLAKAVGGIDAEIKKIDVQPLQKGEDMVRRVTYRVREGKDKWHEYQLAVTQSAKTGEQSLRQLDLGSRDVINRQVTLLGRLRNAWIAVASFAGVTSVFYGFLNSLKQGITLINELDKSMTNMQMITGKSKSEVRDLAMEYSDLATELHSTTKEMLLGAENFLRAGKSIEESKNMLKASTIGSALSGQSNDQTSEQLIAIANGFKLNTSNATELLNVIDKLVAVDNSAATSMTELSTALKYTSSSAQNVGVSLPQVISYIGTVSSISRRSAETIGQSFKTIFSRYESVSAGKDLDDEGEAINDVEKALKNVGIEIRKDATHFREFNEVMDELGVKWKTMNDLQKSQTVGALAG